MNKIKLDNTKSFGFPMPVVLIGSVTEGKTNFMTAAWAARIESFPPLIAVALANHYTNIGIRENNEFSINIPDDRIVSEVDYCGTKSGRTVDKSQIFNLFKGELCFAPMIEECPVAMECSLFKVIEILKHSIFIGEVKGIYSEKKYLSSGKPDDSKIKALMLTMPANNYYVLGDIVGKAWASG